MANIKKRNTTVTRMENKGKQLVINELHIQSPDRTKKDIGTYIQAVEQAESVHTPNRVALFNVYDSVLIDGYLSGIITKRIDTACNKTIVYKDKSGKKVDAMEDLIESEAFQNLKKELLWSEFLGVSGFEFVRGKEFAFEEIPRRHIRPESGKIVIDQYGEAGYNYNELDNIWVVGKKKNLGILYKAAPYSIWKRGDIADWAQYIEIYGQPVTIVRYDGYDEKGKFEAQQLLKNSGSSLKVCLPKELSYEMLDGKTNSNGDGKLQDTFRRAMNEEMAILILGNTETTSSSSSSGYAQAKEHGKQQLEITKSDIKLLKAKLNDKKLTAILKSYSLPVVEGGKFEFEKETDLDELKKRADIDQQLEEGGLPMDDDYKYTTYGIPKPADYDAQKKAREDAAKIPPPNPKDPNDPEPKPKPDPKPPKPEPKEKGKKLSFEQRKTFLFKLRSLVADFFDPAP